jgi:hypothetical protein
MNSDGRTSMDGPLWTEVTGRKSLNKSLMNIRWKSDSSNATNDALDVMTLQSAHEFRNNDGHDAIAMAPWNMHELRGNATNVAL